MFELILTLVLDRAPQPGVTRVRPYATYEQCRADAQRGPTASRVDAPQDTILIVIEESKDWASYLDDEVPDAILWRCQKVPIS